MVLFCSCGTSFPQGKNFSVTLQMDSAIAKSKQKIFLYNREGNQEYLLDSVSTDGKQCKYTFYGFAKYQDEYSLLFEKEGPQKLNFVINPHDKLKLKLNDSIYNDYSFITIDVPECGVQHEYYLYDRANSSLRHKIKLFTREFNDSTLNAKKKKELQDSLNICNKQLKDLYQNLLHSDYPYLADFSIIFFKIDYGGIEPYKDYLLKKFSDYPPLKTSLGITNSQPKTEESKKVGKRVGDIMLGRFVRFKPRTTKSSAIGDDSLKIVLHQGNGKEKYLSDYFGKYVLVDFWASWCDPCIASMPKILVAQKKYEKDLEVCTVSLDKSNILWKKAIAKYHLSPLHHYVGVDSNGNVYKDVEELGFTAIPQNYLLDRKGKIIAINLSGEELMEKMKELCKR